MAPPIVPLCSSGRATQRVNKTFMDGPRRDLRVRHRANPIPTVNNSPPPWHRSQKMATKISNLVAYHFIYFSTVSGDISLSVRSEKHQNFYSRRSDLFEHSHFVSCRVFDRSALYYSREISSFMKSIKGYSHNQPHNGGL